MTAPQVWYVYILLCGNDSLYTGMTSDLERRMEEHFTHRGGHYTQTCGSIRLLWKEGHFDQFAAAKRERQIKGWTRRKKLALIDRNEALLKRL